MKVLRAIISVLITIGAVNWGLVGARRIDLVEKVFGRMSPISRIVYALVGIAGISQIFTRRRQPVA